ncbi:histidinol-phosphatase [Caulobacter sp. S45]|uniref:histidinol-phosphatase n=1 Tax=Caulobacter sp. S45 TaxID=1641861 RepID=UPI00131A996E|nr:histidinol-phosphatase [Caulobacter sp. S45]
MSTDLSPTQLSGFENFAVELARAAGAAILPLFRNENGLEDKGGPQGLAFDPVTAADRGAEAAMRQAIAKRFPDHGVIGEEYGEDKPDAEFVWVLDPVDGTRGFIAGVPLWTTLIALRWQGAPVVGLIAQPYMDEMFVGTALGSRLIHRDTVRPLAVKPCAGLADAIVGVTDPQAYFRPDEQRVFQGVRDAAKLTRMGGDGYYFAMAALGTMDVVVEPAACKAWDVEPAIPLMQGAGGFMTNWRGEPVGAKGGQVLLAGDRRCLDQALALLAPAAD